MITKQAHNQTLILMSEPSGGTSWVNSNFVNDRLAEGYIFAVSDDPVVSDESPAESVDLGDLSSKTKKELVALGKERDVVVNMGMSKDQLIVALEGA
jgi:hypothetical protein